MLDLDRDSYPADYDELVRRGVRGIDVDLLTFSIMHGNGNVILVVDEALSGLSGREIGSDLARELCELVHGGPRGRDRLRPDRRRAGPDDLLRARRYPLRRCAATRCAA